jgi:ankyrin repeat protein
MNNTGVSMSDKALKFWLIQAGFNINEPLRDNINSRISNGTTPLMHAARLGNIEILNTLLTHSADPSLLNADNNGALWFACFANSEASVEALIKAGAPLDTQNVNGATALIYCASAGKTPMVKLLLAAGANTELMTLDDFTALELAANRECMKMLKVTKVASHA